MNKNESSLTSLISAFGRAYHSKVDKPIIFDDYIAKELISDHEFKEISSNMIQGIQFFNKLIAEKFKDNPKEILKWITQVQLSPTPLARAAYCENVLQNEIILGTKQYIILGAGLDTYCFRHPELLNILEIFEIDSPETQRFKQSKLEHNHYEIPGNLHFVPMDFTKQFMYLPLIEGGLKAHKTFVSLLGVTYYLTKKELGSLLEQLFSYLPDGSSIVLDYADENLFTEKGISNRVRNMVNMAEAAGEPMKSCFTYSEMEELLDTSNLLIYEHLTPAEINDRYFKDRDDYLTAFEMIHYIHAVKKRLN